ncbi:Putative Histone lysine methyltransferase Set3 [Rhizopus microsporus]|nr:Putative Histone lysine methyltransferase Set3 [Rhizopus microsporus]
MSQSPLIRQRADDLDISNSVDSGLIRCICSSTEDDGFTIQCEQCLVWQHAYCVQITSTSIPDHYLCDQCSSNSIGKKRPKRPKLSKRITISKKKLSKLDSEDDPSFKKKKPVKSRVISRYAYAIFNEARERWKQHWKYDHNNSFLYDLGAFVTMDMDTLLTKGVLMNAPVSSQGLFATRSVPSGQYLMEVTGDILLKSEYKFDPLNDFVILGTPLSHIMFFPSLDLCIDTRQFGNKARYIRRSCQPNAELRNMVLPREDSKSVHLGLFSRRLIEKGQEVTISWSWQRGHVTWKEYMDWHHKSRKEDRNKVIDEEEERKKRSTIQMMLERFEKEFGACACLNKRKCLIEHLKRQCAPKKSTDANRHRSKPSILLLKPKPVIEENVNDEYVDITSNSPTLQPSKSPQEEEDELLDIDGDIDIMGNDPSNELPPMDENQNSDNEDLSSLSSLSSLSILGEEKENEQHTSKNALNPLSARAYSSTPCKGTAALPRKKLWARDYLNKHQTENITDKQDIKDEPNTHENDNHKPLEESECVVKSEDDNSSNDIPNLSFENEAVQEEEEDQPEKHSDGNNIPQIDTLEDDNELSDASTVLLEDVC